MSKLIEDRAEHLRKDGETREVAYARYISGGLGARLYTIMARSPGMDHHQAAALRKHARPGEEVPAGEHELPGRPDQDIDDGVDPFHAAIEKLVDKFMEAPGPGRQMTRAVAYDHVATKTKLGQDSRERRRTISRGLTRQCPKGSQASEKPSASHRWICLTLGGIRRGAAEP